jgi:hypothetical protein
MAFPVTCPACGKAFQLATDIYERKVAGKIVSIKCKQCQSGIRVDATQPGELKVVGATPAGGGDLSVGPKPPAAPQAKPAAAPAASPDRPQAAPVRMRQPTLIGMVNPLAGKPGAPAAAARSPAAPTTPALWAVDAGGEGDDRELSEDEIQREIRAGNLTAQTLAWREGMGEWLEIEKIPELSKYLALAGREEPKTVPPPARAKEQGAKAQRANFQDEPDAEATMVYDRSAPNAALEAFAGVDQDTTARMELPAPEKEVTARVMLSETARMAEPLPPPPAAPLPAAGRPAAFAKTTPLADAPPPPPPLPPGRSSPLAASPPAARPTPPPPAQPPAVRPAPPPVQPAAEAPPPPPPALPAAAPPAPAFPSPPAQAPMLAAVPWGDALPSAKPAVPGLPTAPYGPDPFAVAATTDLDFPNPKSKRPLVIALAIGAVVVIGIVIAVATSGPPPVANVAPPPPAPTTTTAPTESPKTEPTATSQPTQGDSQGSTTTATQPQTPSGNFSDLFSKGAKAKGSGPGKGFNEAEAREALSGLLKSAAACKEPGGQMGQTTATITFEASGNVSGVTVGAPFAGTSTGTCIIAAFKRAKVAPFSGLPGTVSQTISLR